MGYIPEDKNVIGEIKMIIVTLVPVVMVAMTLAAMATIKYSDRFLNY